MSDLENLPDPAGERPGEAATGEPTAAGEPARRPSPGAQAASRARRIGGRPRPSPLPAPGTEPEHADTDTDIGPESGTDTDGTDEAAAATVSAEKKVREKPATVADSPETAPARTEDEAEALRRKLDRLRWLPAGMAALLVAVLAIAIVVASHSVWWAKRSDSEVRDEVLAAAKTCLAATNSFDYRKIDEAEAAGLRCATGKFRDSYKQSMDTVIKKLAPERQATQTVQVNKAGVASVSKDGKQWVILIYGQQQVTNNTTAKDKPRLDILSAKVTMDRVGDKWLISALAAA